MLAWYDIYGFIAEGLARFYNKHRENSGRMLFNLCMNSSNTYIFREENPWINKFKKEWDRPSIDPVHIFASFNYSKIPHKKRVDTINFYFDILEVDYVLPYNEVNFDGIPAPRIDTIVGARSLEMQNEIWQFFNTFYIATQNKQEYEFLIETKIFHKINNWYGIARPSLTMFLFWIDSNRCIPLDTNTRDLLKSQYKKTPNTIEDYIKLNQEFITIQGPDSIRNLVKTAYKNYSIYEDKIPSIQESFLIEQINLQQANQEKPESLNRRLQILAIKPLQGCEPKFLKILNETLYTFSTLYTINEDSIDKINEPYEIYDIDNIKIHVNAIAGENGAGKSTIIELLMIAFNNIAKKLEDSLEIEYVDNIHLDLFIFFDQPYKFEIRNKVIRIYEYNKYTNNKYKKNPMQINSFTLDSFFYTIFLNYSLHGLNALYYGSWLDSLFHKNDAYQTPIVIEPFRENGNIDVNKQIQLVKSRLLSNLLEKCDTPEAIAKYRKLTNYQYAKELDISINFTKLDKIIDEDIRGERYSFIFEDFDKQHIEEVLSEIFKVFEIDHINPAINLNEKYCSIENISKLYLFKKLILIVLRYKHYTNFFNKETQSIELVINSNDRHGEELDLLENIRKDPSHITYKIKQIINFIKYFSKYEELENFEESDFLQKISKKILLDKIADKIYQMMTEDGTENINEFIIPSIFNIDIIMDEDNRFATLSSGEQQLIYATNSILYQLKNISSVDEENLIQYECITIILEEIELYFHPDLQRKFLNKLLSTIRLSLERAQLENLKSINIVFITHSPFILSDIPSDNLMLLERDDIGKTIQVKSSSLKTFGSNIHELLSKSFFLDKTIGEISNQKIEDIINFFNNKNADNEGSEWLHEKEIYKVIMAIGEPFLREKLLEMYGRKFSLPNEQEIYSIDEEIKKLEAKKELIRKNGINDK